MYNYIIGLSYTAGQIIFFNKKWSNVTNMF
jgi:hypothetical protein